MSNANISIYKYICLHFLKRENLLLKKKKLDLIQHAQTQ